MVRGFIVRGRHPKGFVLSSKKVVFPLWATIGGTQVGGLRSKGVVLTSNPAALRPVANEGFPEAGGLLPQERTVSQSGLVRAASRARPAPGGPRLLHDPAGWEVSFRSQPSD